MRDVKCGDVETGLTPAWLSRPHVARLRHSCDERKCLTVQLLWHQLPLLPNPEKEERQKESLGCKGRRSPVKKTADSPEERPGDNLFCGRQIRIACISCRHWRLVTVNSNGISTGDVSFLIHQPTSARSRTRTHTHARPHDSASPYICSLLWETQQ